MLLEFFRCKVVQAAKNKFSPFPQLIPCIPFSCLQHFLESRQAILNNHAYNWSPWFMLDLNRNGFSFSSFRMLSLSFVLGKQYFSYLRDFHLILFYLEFLKLGTAIEYLASIDWSKNLSFNLSILYINT